LDVPGAELLPAHNTPNSQEEADLQKPIMNARSAEATLARDKLALDDNAASQMLYGQKNENLRQVEREMGVDVHSRGNELTLVGDAEAVQLARGLLEQLYALARRGRPLGPEDVSRAARMLRADASAEIKDIFSDTVLVASRARPITPKGLAQKRYVEAIRADDIVFGIGPAGTGKTYLAMAVAVRHLMDKLVKRIVLCRPAVEAGERLGFLPGSMEEKVNPYLRPLYDALHDMMDIDRAHQLVERGIIEVAPLAFMRGRTLNDAFVILDEAQNTTTEQMKMFLTRLGFNSKAVITGDVTQIDLPVGMRSGLMEARDLLSKIEGIEFCYFTEVDVVRHPLVQEVIKAYDRLAREKAESKSNP
jgi:phosphate starvation-inducible PhoH-like protein